MRIIALCLLLAVKTASHFAASLASRKRPRPRGPARSSGSGRSRAAPRQQRGLRILYRSTGLKRRADRGLRRHPFPSGPAPAGGRHVIAWAHPTSGVVTACAPTLMPDNSGMIWGLPDMLAQGYVVVATDYPGLGTPGIHPYLIGISEARAVLDSVRAARALPNTGASNRFAVWGNSQGGHAALYTASLRKLCARAQGGRRRGGRAATYLAELFDADSATATGKELTAMTIYSWSKLTTPGDHAGGAGRLGGRSSRWRMTASSRCRVPGHHRRGETAPDREVSQADQPSPSRGGGHAAATRRSGAGRAPVLIAQGTADTTVRPGSPSSSGSISASRSAPRPHVAQRGQPHLRGERQRKTDARLDRRPLQGRRPRRRAAARPWPVIADLDHGVAGAVRLTSE